MSISIEIQNGNTANDLKQISAGTAENVLKLNISDTGAHEIRIQNINTHGYKGCFTTGGIYEFIFDGTYWICTNSNISAADQSENASYIKYTNGLIKQWGKKQGNIMRVDFPVVFSKCLYFNFIAYRTQSTGDGWHYYNNLTPRGVNMLSENEGALWIAIGI